MKSGNQAKFTKATPFGRAFRFSKGDVVKVVAVRENGAISFTSEKYPDLPFLLPAEDKERLVSVD